MKTINCRNMACPAPVVTTKRALEAAGEDTVQVLVDPGAPRENVTRFARNRGYTVTETELEGGYALTITAGETVTAVPQPDRTGNGKPVMMITSDRIGNGPEDLGRLLMKNFIITLLDLAELPDRMLFLNSGVLLTCKGSEVLEALEQLGNRGVEILSCGICLDYFHKKDTLAAGTVTNMFTTAESIMQAGSMINI